MMNFGIVEDDNVKGIGMVSGEGIQEALKRSQIELEGSFKIGFAGGRGDDAKKIKRLKAMLAKSGGFNPGQGQAATGNGV